LEEIEKRDEKNNGRTSLANFTERVWQFEEPMNLQIQFVHNSLNESLQNYPFAFIQSLAPTCPNQGFKTSLSD
jgi:hypothetical protein